MEYNHSNIKIVFFLNISVNMAKLSQFFVGTITLT